MNPLGPMPGTSSEQFSLNTLDWMKILRFLLVQVIGVFVTMVVPWALGLTYVYNGHDFTAIVVMLVNTLAEAGRRFLSTSPK